MIRCAPATMLPGLGGDEARQQAAYGASRRSCPDHVSDSAHQSCETDHGDFT